MVAAHLAFPEKIFVAANLSVHRRKINCFGHTMNDVEVKWHERAANISEIAPKSVKQSSGAESHDVMSLLMRIALDIVPKLRRVFMPPQGLIKVPTETAILRDVIHHEVMS